MMKICYTDMMVFVFGKVGMDTVFDQYSIDRLVFVFETSLIGRYHEEQFGTANEAELIMLRGTGDFSIDWSNPQQYEPVLNRQICNAYLNELSRHWHRTEYYLC
uniref:Uncharacterized protein n=1 Tax=Acrobeloides nanus TaxID=290746 RepID=A0A914ELR7_9BILA